MNWILYNIRQIFKNRRITALFILAEILGPVSLSPVANIGATFLLQLIAILMGIIIAAILQGKRIDASEYLEKGILRYEHNGEVVET